MSNQLAIFDIDDPSPWRGMPSFSTTPKLTTHPSRYAYSGGLLPRYPVFVLTKGRWERRLTVKLLERLGIPYRLVLEAQEVERYAEVVDPSRFLVVPHRDKGLVATQNWVHDYARDMGHPWFWALHDDIRNILRVNLGGRIPVDGTALYAIEDLVMRYDNVALAGMNFAFRVWPSRPGQPVQLNCLIPGNHRLIRTDSPFRPRDGYGWEDHDLCLRVVKAGWCTVRFNAFVVDTSESINTAGGQKVGGINFGDGYASRLTSELVQAHPDAVIGTRRTETGVRPTVTYRRWIHNHLIPRGPLSDGVNEFGMTLGGPG